MTTLEDYAEVNPPVGSLDRSSSELVTFLPMAAVSEEGVLVSQAMRPLLEVAKGFTYFERGDVLMAKITPCMENGKAVLLSGLRTFRGFGSTEFHVLRPRPGVDPRFLFYLVWSQRFRKEAAKHMTGSAGQKRVPAAYLRRALVPTVDASKQRRIADILDRADAICRSRKGVIALSEELLRSVFLRLFGDPVTNPMGWTKSPLAMLGRITTGNTPPRAKPEYFGDAIEWIKSDNINTSGHFLTRAAEGLSAEGKKVGRSVPAGSVLITCIAGSPDCIGNVALADREVAFNQQINAVTANPGVDYRYLYVLLLVGKRLIQSASTNSMKGMVSKGRLEMVAVPFPPYAKQEEFGRIFERLLQMNQKSGDAYSTAQTLFESLVNESCSVTGVGTRSA